MTMAHSIESRVPFLDLRLIEVSTCIPRKYKVDKYILKKAVTGMVPKEVIMRKKHPFYIPIDSWFNKGLRDVSRQILIQSPVIKRMFSRRYVDGLLAKGSKSHLLHSRQLWSLLTFAVWHKVYIENEIERPVLDIDKLY